MIQSKIEVETVISNDHFSRTFSSEFVILLFKKEKELLQLQNSH